MKNLSIILATLLLASCSTTGMTSGGSTGEYGGADTLYSTDCGAHPNSMYCGGD